MRIIAGTHKGHPLVTPVGDRTRPTLGRVREALFSVVAPAVPGAHVIDLFAGSGALGFEALSRGAASCIFVEHSRPALQCLRRNAEKLGHGREAEIVQADAFRWMRANTSLIAACDLLLADPPYDEGHGAKLLEFLGTLAWTSDRAIIIIQESRATAMPEGAGVLDRTGGKIYGETSLNYYRPSAAANAPD